MNDEYYCIEKRFAELKAIKKNPQEIQEMLDIALRIESFCNHEAISLVEDLKSVGIRVLSVWDLVNTNKPYPMAIPILIKHLRMEYSVRNKEGIIRALATKEAKGIACRPLLNEYIKIAQDPNYNFHYKWVFGLALYNTITKEYIDDVIELVLDERNGDSRDFFVRALTRVKDERCKQTFVKLLNDPSDLVKKEAERALKKYK